MEKFPTEPIIMSTTSTISRNLLEIIKLLGPSEEMQMMVLLAAARSIRIRNFMGVTTEFQINQRSNNNNSF